MALGETDQFVWDYSEHSDILNIHKKSIATAGSAELGDFTVDFDAAGNIVGVEIMNATEFLKEAEITLEQLAELNGAGLLIKQGRGGEVTYIWLKLTFSRSVERRIPLPAPVLVKV